MNATPPPPDDPPVPSGSTRTGAQMAVHVALGLGAVVALALLLGPFLPALVTASVLALILLPVHRRVRRLVRQPEIAAGVSTALGIVGLLVPLFLLGALVVRELAAASEMLASEIPDFLASLPRLERTVELWGQRVGLPDLQVGEAVATRIREAPGFLLGRAFGVLRGVGGLALQAGVALFTLYFLLRDEHRVDSLLRSLIPLDPNRTSALLYRAREVVSAAIYGNLLVAVTQGMLGGLAFLALGLPTPVLWGSVMGAGSLVPMVGPGVVWVPTVILLIVGGSVLRGVLLLVFGLLVISTVDNVIRSIFVGSRARIHPLAIFLGVIGGLVLFGAVGVFVGPVMLVVSLLLLEMVRLSLYPHGAGEGTEVEAPGEV